MVYFIKIQLQLTNLINSAFLSNVAGGKNILKLNPAGRPQRKNETHDLPMLKRHFPALQIRTLNLENHFPTLWNHFSILGGAPQFYKNTFQSCETVFQFWKTIFKNHGTVCQWCGTIFQCCKGFHNIEKPFPNIGKSQFNIWKPVPDDKSPYICMKSRRPDMGNAFLKMKKSARKMDRGRVNIINVRFQDIPAEKWDGVLRQKPAREFSRNEESVILN